MNASDLPASGLGKARIEIIPLIDVIFFLLATFVLFTLSLNKIRSLEVPLPVAGPPAVEETTVYIQTSETGTFYWKQGRAGVAELITTAELAPRLAEYRARVANPRVFVRGDGQAKFGAAVRALDEVRRAGIAQAGIETVTSGTGN